MTSINTNLSSLIVQKNLTKSTNALNQAVERLTTGFKINHASDNAANYSISESMTSKLSSYMVAEENTSMGLDLIQTQSSTLDTIQNLTTRLRALAEQAHNGTYGAQSLAAINQEADAIIEEITRIGNNAEYNGIKLFDNAISQMGVPQLKSNGLMQEVERRDTSGMTRLADVDTSSPLARGTYSITTTEELAKLAEIVNNGDSVQPCEFVLGADIDLSAYSEGEGWTPIGSVSNFCGRFDGNGYTVSNLYISASDDSANNSFGLFGVLYNCDVKNLVIKDCNIFVNGVKSSAVGGLAGKICFCDIDNVSVTGTVKAENKGCAGLLAGCLQQLFSTADNNVDSCYTSGDVSAVSSAGGMFGLSERLILTNSFSEGEVISSSYAGGISGKASNTDIRTSASSCIVNAEKDAGGIIGTMTKNDTINNHLEDVVYIGNKISAGETYNSGLLIGFLDNNGVEESVVVSGVYDSLLQDNINAIGRVGNLEKLSLNVKDTSSQLQVGADSTESSAIKFSTNISLTPINTLRMCGMEGTNSLENIDNFISKLSEAQTKLGAIENRLTSTIESIGVNIENLTSSRSTLKDADVAKESSQLLKNQILQQAAATLLSTANQTPSLALRLLNGI